jgi:hypothetical protein
MYNADVKGLAGKILKNMVKMNAPIRNIKTIKRSSK